MLLPMQRLLHSLLRGQFLQRLLTATTEPHLDWECLTRDAVAHSEGGLVSSIAVSIVCVSLELSIFLSKIRQGVHQKTKIAHFSFAA
jgi:hypothetical protein